LNYGIIDLGSNTIRLSIYREEEHNAKELLNKKELAALSSYVSDGVLSDKGISKASEILNNFKGILADFNIENYSVFATASLRNISNTDEALKQIEADTGIKVDLLSGEEEARLGFIGASHAAATGDGLFVDIGGGSTELLVIRNKAIRKAVSMPIGSLNLFLRHVSSLQPTKKELNDIKDDILIELEKTGIPDFGPQNLIFGIGGTARAARKLYNDVYSLQDSNRFLEMQKLNDLLLTYKHNRGEISRRILQLSPERIHTIIPGMMIIRTIGKSVKGIDIIISNNGVREGYLFKRVMGV
jgi:exopolyphosphatase / guanosine-5'-triphosphate,3'-diphosphate pyrophosphatase